MKFIDGAARFLTVVMRPSVSSVEPITNCIWAATKQKEQIEQAILELVEAAETFSQALDIYYYRFGHLPLAKSLSITRVIDEWEKRKGKQKKLWEAIWNWTESKDSPLPRYHACLTFTSKPELLRSKRIMKFWNEIVEIISVKDSDELNMRWSQAWKIRCRLAKHFSIHLESRLPGADSERITSQAWWLAEQIALLFGTTPDRLQNIRKETMEPELDISTAVWHIARALIRPSRLRYATMLTHSIWSLSLLCQMGPNLERLPTEKLKIKQKQKIDAAIFGSLGNLFPLTRQKPEVYAFDKTIIQTARKWGECCKVHKESIGLETFIETLAKISNEGNLKELLTQLPSMTGPPQELVACVFRNAAHSGQVYHDFAWKLMLDPEWRRNLLLKSQQRIIEIVFDGLSEVLVRGKKDRIFQMPHIFAEACEQSTNNKDLKELLFDLTLYSSMMIDSVSAIERILKGVHRSVLNENISYWGRRLGQLRPYCPNIVKGRIRATLACLNAI